nr:hypothetical protein [Epilithonimonas hispanica]
MFCDIVPKSIANIISKHSAISFKSAVQLFNTPSEWSAYINSINETLGAVHFRAKL